LESYNKNGGKTAACGVLNAHFQSNQHKAGKAKPGKSITSWFSATSRQPQSSSTPRQETPAAS
jgi:hypothetical protein